MRKKLSLLSSIVLTIPYLISHTYGSLSFVKETKAVSALTESSLSSKMNIDINPVSEDEIRSYYSSLSSLEDAEKTGINLLKNLKPILRKNFEFYSYTNIWKIYEITDRDWDLSPADEITNGSFNSETNIISNYQFKVDNANPYVHAYYRDHTSSDPKVIEDSKIFAWGDHNASGINREHIWPQSHGFKASSGANGPAGTDLHHLVAADGYVNQSLHNNDAYGYVKEGKEDKIGSRPSTKQNKVGEAKNRSVNDLASRVFEPQDQDKGDIARACFYMVAMYNNLAHESNVITKYDANLDLVMYITEGAGSEWGSDTYSVKLGNLADLLEWNKLDPVDEYEIHRNDLIFNNFQHNRNPFIDFPSWADIVWGDLKNTKVANPTSDGVYTWSETPSPSSSSEPQFSESADISSSEPQFSESADISSSEIAPISSSSEGESSSLPIEFDQKVLILIVVVLLIILILIIVIFVKSNKKKRKKMIKKASKVIKQVNGGSSKNSRKK